ncbi:MAG: hypothetical protein WCC04_22345 [Terriglobales bacterium]
MTMQVAVLAFFLTVSAWGRTHKKSAETSPSGPEYVVALATANRFLHAWQTGDLADGIGLVSDGIRHAQTAGELERFFSAETDRAFEIRAGHGNRGRYSFPLVLVTLKPVQGSNGHQSVSRRSSEIILVNAGKDDWVVDKLP